MDSNFRFRASGDAPHRPRGEAASHGSDHATVVAMRVEDYYPGGKRWWVRLHEKGGKRHEMLAHHKLEQFLDEYLAAAGIRENGKTPLFRAHRQADEPASTPTAWCAGARRRRLQGQARLPRVPRDRHHRRSRGRRNARKRAGDGGAPKPVVRATTGPPRLVTPSDLEAIRIPGTPSSARRSAGEAGGERDSAWQIFWRLIPGSRVRTRLDLAAGGRWIRTLGPQMDRVSRKWRCRAVLGPSPTACGKRLSFAAVKLIYIAALHRLDQQFAERPHQGINTVRQASEATRQAVASLLRDPIRAVRIEAARALAGTDLLSLTPELQTAMVSATKELVAAEMVDADRPEAHLNLGLLDLRRRQMPEAEAEYRTAVRLEPGFVPAMVNLADLDRLRGVDQEGAELLKKAMTIEPDNADVRYALGLSLVRRHDYAGALDLLRRAHELVPDNARYAYVYAVALNSTGAPGEAMTLLEEAHQRHPADRDTLMALVSIARDKGDFALALRYARELVTLDPGNAQLRALLSDLERR
jgi:tetratricopeptide (TPR) repeat protein